MQKLINEVFVLFSLFGITKNENGGFSFNMSWVDFMRSFITPMIIGALGVFVTLQVMKKDIEFQAATLTRMERQLTTVCMEVAAVAREQAIIKTRQDERIERERAIGIRR